MKKELNSDAFIWALISALHIQIKPLVKEKAQMCAKLFLWEFNVR